MADLTESDIRERTRALLDEIHPERSDAFTFRRAQYDHGLAWVHFPEGLGGLGVSPKLNAVVTDEIAKHSKVIHGDPPAAAIGIGMGAPVVATHGTEWMQQELLPKIFTGEEIWCQMFSEPSAGSDVAGLSTRAVRDGDDWIVNGQKVWTTVAHLSKWGMLVARTNPSTTASPTSCSTWRRPASRSGPSTRSRARPSSTKSSSTTSASPTSACSARRVRAGASRSRR